MTSSSAQPTNQRPNSATTAPARSTALLSPYHQCFRLGVQSYTPAPIRPTSGPGPRIQERLHGLRRDQIHLLNVRSRALRNPFRRPFADPPQTLHHQSMGGPEATTAATPWPSNTGSTRLRSQPNYPPPMANKPCPPTTPRLISRPRAVLLAPPPCFQEAECHGQSTTSSPHDQSGQRRIHEELADAHLALRPALHMPSHPPPPPSPSRVRLGRPQPGASPCSLALKVTDSAGGGSTRVPRILYASPGSVLCMCMNPEATGSPPSPLPHRGRPASQVHRSRTGSACNIRAISPLRRVLRSSIGRPRSGV